LRERIRTKQSGPGMNKAQAYRRGVGSGYEAGIYGDFTAKEVSDEDAFAEAAAEICDNKRQFADSPTYAFARQPNSENLFDAFDNRHKSGGGTGGEPVEVNH
jgi:hypothetical protein